MSRLSRRQQACREQSGFDVRLVPRLPPGRPPGLRRTRRRQPRRPRRRHPRRSRRLHLPAAAMRVPVFRGALVLVTVVFSTLLAGCGGGGAGNGSLQVPAPNALTVAEVQQIMAQAVFEAQARNAKATIGIVDRVGNVLGIFKMNGAAPTFTISGGKGAVGGLEGLMILPPEYAVVPKAFTAAYFSSAGNAFTTRTAGQIIQEHFNPEEFDQPAGPLFGVQFSQLTCSDVSQKASPGTMVGPHRSPLGFAADPGGLPLYKNGAVVGAIGVLADGLYTIDRDVINVDNDIDEFIAVAGTQGFAAPTAIRA